MSSTLDPAALLDEDKVVEIMIREVAKREALRRIAAGDAQTVIIPEIRLLADLLLVEMAETKYRVADWQPVDSRVVLAAQNKGGKTTMRDNLTRSLVDGVPWLDVAEVEPVGIVTIIDNEMSEKQAIRWLREQGIQNTDCIDFIALRGNVRDFNIIDDATRARWADRLAHTDYLIFDCLRPSLDALGLDEQRDTGKFLLPFDSLMKEAGIRESLIVHHMGHTSGRSRGDSRLRDWPDVEWFLERKDPNNPASDRFVRAYGRDVDVPKGKLRYNPDNRHLSYTSSELPVKVSKVDTALNAVCRYLDAHGPTSQGAIEDSMPYPDGVSRNNIRTAFDTGLARGVLAVDKGAKGAKIWRRAELSAASTGS